jgi:catechol 2,3-dioxygenase-like lactoylglutathione lyase family enzyme
VIFMIDHISLRVQDYRMATAFYKAALAPLGYEVVMEFPEVVGLGAGGKPDLWIAPTDQPVHPTHLAFRCGRQQVDAFHAAALAAGGIDHGPPGLRPEFHEHYYAAFVLDGEGNNMEAVCHDPPGADEAPATSSKPAKAAPAAARKPAKRPSASAAAPATRAAVKAPAKASAKKPGKKPPTTPAKKPVKSAGRASTRPSSAKRSAPKSPAKPAKKPAKKPAGKRR